ncbi:RNA ligase 1 [Aeromonas phage B614]|nr:RNA ligase 1 [Aeromonas phage B614]UYD58305.1 RNA ligase 1 [Aeromonas phage UP87]UYD58419.1 RNA ligase 1 [Aeromonas phage avDM14-QBC]UYD58635.1 RNA ligase 1 [Aeromonas phage avDM10-HWA]UYD59062.1 RNA ligase 1 [Aeromonas phage avDM7-IJDJ]UYD59874.1 RNA ligase 1 [Aeromonas phage avDM9-HANS]
MKELYFQLMNVVEKSEKGNFYFKDVTTSMGTKARIFNYFIGSYSDWLVPGALECRGIMFEITEDGQPVRIMARPMQKFFNLKENPMTIGLDLTKLVGLMEKADGSLISSYHDQGYVYLKSKAAIFSDQANKAMALLNSPGYEHLLKFIKECGPNYTFNMEYVGPSNRIVLPYEEEELIILNVRHNETGQYIGFTDLIENPATKKRMVGVYPAPDWNEMTPDEWEAKVRAETDIEGVIGVMEDGQLFKLKTDWYSALHRTKDSINNNKALFQSIKERASDDLRGLFADDAVAIKKIEAFESAYIDAVGTQLALCENAMSQLRGLDRRSFAIKGQEILSSDRHLFTVIMQQYGRDWDGELAVEKIEEHLIKEYARYVPVDYR